MLYGTVSRLIVLTLKAIFIPILIEMKIDDEYQPKTTSQLQHAGKVSRERFMDWLHNKNNNFVYLPIDLLLARIYINRYSPVWLWAFNGKRLSTAAIIYWIIQLYIL